MNNPYREPDDEGSLRARLAKAEANIAALQSPMRRAAWAGWRWLGWALLVCLGLALASPLAWLCFRGSRWGATARANSEREALRWAKARWPNVEAGSVYCRGGVGEQCIVRAPDGIRYVVHCDDDAPVSNDGCSSGREATPQESGDR